MGELPSLCSLRRKRVGGGGGGETGWRPQKDGSRMVGMSPASQSQPQALGFKNDRNLKMLNCFKLSSDLVSFIPHAFSRVLDTPALGKGCFEDWEEGIFFFPLLEAMRPERAAIMAGEKRTWHSQPKGSRIPKLQRPEKCTPQASSTHTDTPLYCPFPSQDPQKHQGGPWTSQNMWDGDSCYLTAKERGMLQSWQT